MRSVLPGHSRVRGGGTGRCVGNASGWKAWLSISQRVVCMCARVFMLQICMPGTRMWMCMSCALWYAVVVSPLPVLAKGLLAKHRMCAHPSAVGSPAGVQEPLWVWTDLIRVLCWGRTHPRLELLRPSSCHPCLWRGKGTDVTGSLSQATLLQRTGCMGCGICSAVHAGGQRAFTGHGRQSQGSKGFRAHRVWMII